MNCYGTNQYGKKKSCKNCELATYCQSAKNPASFAIEYNDQIPDVLEEQPFTFFDDPQKDAPPSQEQLQLHALCFSLRNLISRIIEVTHADPIRSFIILGRIGGLTQTQIGKTCGMTKQAISKHCNSIFSQNKELHAFLKIPFAPDESFKTLFTKSRYDVRRNDGRRKKNITN